MKLMYPKNYVREKLYSTLKFSHLSDDHHVQLAL